MDLGYDSSESFIVIIGKIVIGISWKSASEGGRQPAKRANLRSVIATGVVGHNNGNILASGTEKIRANRDGVPVAATD